MGKLSEQATLPIFIFVSLLKGGQLLKERIAFLGENFFSLREACLLKGKTNRKLQSYSPFVKIVVKHGVVPIYLIKRKYCVY